MHFTSKAPFLKLKTFQKRTLWFVLNCYDSNYKHLPQNCNVTGEKWLAIKVYKSIIESIPAALNEIFNIQNIYTAYVMIVFPQDQEYCF